MGGGETVLLTPGEWSAPREIRGSKRNMMDTKTSKDIACCELCGRDTRNRSRVCRYCTGGQSGALKHARQARWAERKPIESNTELLDPRIANGEEVDRDEDIASEAARAVREMMGLD